MKQYTVAKICGFAAGTLLSLDKEQVDRRRAVLDETDTEGVYLTNQPVQFKVGEVIGVDPSLIGKGMIDAFGSDEEPKKEAEEEAELKADQKPKRNQGRNK